MLQTRHSTLAFTPKSALSATSLTDPFAKLMVRLGEACEGAADAIGDRIVAALRATAATPNLLGPEFCVARPHCYARHIIASDPARCFTVLSIVWGSGQFSPPHAHDTWCAYAVVENALTETLYDFDAQSGKAVASRAVAREPGYACFAGAGLDQIHRLGNAGGVSAISIHVYGVEGSRVGTHVNRLMDVAERER